MKKKFLAMALGIAVVLSCTACGHTENQGNIQ